MVFHAECPGVFTKEFTANRFAVFVVVTIDTRAYYNDEPLLLRSLKPGFAENLSSAPEIYINGTRIPVTISEPTGLSESIDEAIAGAENLTNTLKDISIGNIDDLQSIECPPGDERYQTTPNNINFDITGAGGEIVNSITTDLNQRETSNCSEVNVDELIGSFLNSVPDMPRTSEPGDMNVVCSLPDSYIKEKLMVSTKGVTDSIDEYKESLNSMTGTIDDITKDLWNKTGLDPGEVPSDLQQWFSDQIINESPIPAESIDQYYGIPLIELDAGIDGDGTDSLILQVDTKHEWRLNVVNFQTMFSEAGMELSIEDEKIYPGVKFIAGFITDGIRHTLVLKNLIPGHETKSVTVTKPHEFTINSIGCDTRQIKHLCGTIHDIYIWNWAVPSDVEKIKDEDYRPPYPFGALAFYDFYYLRIVNNLVHEVKDFLNPARIGGIKGQEWTLFDDDVSKIWKFMQNGYLEDFFCRRKFLDKSFSIIWHHQIREHGYGIQCLVSDDINHNYLYYDYLNLEFVIKFNGHTYRWFFIMPEKRWMQYSLRYDQPNGILEVGVIDFESGLQLKKSVDIGNDLTFELMSMLAKYNSVEKRYEDKFFCSFGMLMLFDDYRNDDFLKKYFNEEKPVIEELVPYP